MSQIHPSRMYKVYHRLSLVIKKNGREVILSLRLKRQLIFGCFKTSTKIYIVDSPCIRVLLSSTVVTMEFDRKMKYLISCWFRSILYTLKFIVFQICLYGLLFLHIYRVWFSRKWPENRERKKKHTHAQFYDVRLDAQSYIYMCILVCFFGYTHTTLANRILRLKTCFFLLRRASTI